MILRTSNRAGPTYEVRCDSCSASFDADTGSFKTAVAALRGRGWRTERKPERLKPAAPGAGYVSVTQLARDASAWESGWAHFCPACAAARPANNPGETGGTASPAGHRRERRPS